jgi:hypothetical protein
VLDVRIVREGRHKTVRFFPADVVKQHWNEKKKKKNEQ